MEPGNIKHGGFCFYLLPLGMQMASLISVSCSLWQSSFLEIWWLNARTVVAWTVHTGILKLSSLTSHFLCTPSSFQERILVLPVYEPGNHLLWVTGQSKVCLLLSQAYPGLSSWARRGRGGTHKTQTGLCVIGPIGMGEGEEEADYPKDSEKCLA